MPDVTPVTAAELDRLVEPVTRSRADIEADLRARTTVTPTQPPARATRVREGHDGW